jgi:carboxyl-terminal processing protease
MTDSNGCKTVVLVVLVALLMGIGGFVGGFALRSALPADLVAFPIQDPACSPQVLLPTAVPSSTPASGIDPATAAPAEPTAAPAAESPMTEEDLELFWEAWQLVQEEFYGELPDKDSLTYGIIAGAVNTLGDPYTAFIEPKVAAILREDSSGSFQGIGAYVRMVDGLLEIANTIADQPAEKAGLRAGDIILQVGDTVIENMSVYEAIGLIRGPAGTPVRLTIGREGEEPFEVEVVRAKIDIQLVESQMRDDGIGYVSLSQFDQEASARLEAAIADLLEQNPKGLILDLRNNPGGYLNEAEMTAGLFLPRDTQILIERFKDGTERPYRTLGDPVAAEIPMVVLVDEGSASASEIVAGALQDLNRAVLIGQKTFGKGSVQLLHELSDGSELRVTVARWFTPNGRAIHGEGLTPDIVVEITPEDAEADRDPQLDRAVEYLLTGK